MNSTERISNYIKELISEETGVRVSEIKDSDSFFDLGLDSISAIYLLEVIENHYNITISPIDFWDYPTIKLFSEKINIDNFNI